VILVIIVVSYRYPRGRNPGSLSIVASKDHTAKKTPTLKRMMATSEPGLYGFSCSIIRAKSHSEMRQTTRRGIMSEQNLDIAFNI